MKITQITVSGSHSKRSSSVDGATEPYLDQSITLIYTRTRNSRKAEGTTLLNHFSYCIYNIIIVILDANSVYLGKKVSVFHSRVWGNIRRCCPLCPLSRGSYLPSWKHWCKQLYWRSADWWMWSVRCCCRSSAAAAVKSAHWETHTARPRTLDTHSHRVSHVSRGTYAFVSVFMMHEIAYTL